MQQKLCSRCQFAVPASSKICPICGNKQFAKIETVVVETAPMPDEISLDKIVDRVRCVMHDFADDVTLTAEKSARALRQIQKLIRG